MTDRAPSDKGRGKTPNFAGLPSAWHSGGVRGYWVFAAPYTVWQAQVPIRVRAVYTYFFKGCRIQMWVVNYIVYLRLDKRGPLAWIWCFGGACSGHAPAIPPFVEPEVQDTKETCLLDPPPSSPPPCHTQGVGILWLNGDYMSNSQGLPANSGLCLLCVRLEHKGQQLAGRVWTFGLEWLPVSLWSPLWCTELGLWR